MSVSQIIKELPRLSITERRKLANRLQELEPESDVLDLCDALSLDAVSVLDQMEVEDVQSKKR